jgi:hypothetical protein
MEEYYIFLDESGTSSLKNIDPLFPVLVLTGLLISRDEYGVLIDRISQLKQTFFPGKQVVLHRRDMRKHEKGFEILFDDDVKRRFYHDLNQILSDVDYKLISSAIDKERHIENYGKLANDPYQIALTFVLERALFEADERNARIQPYIESRGKKEDKIVAARYNELIHRGSHQVSTERFLNRFSTDIMLRKKENGEIGIEIADLCAYPIARYVLNNNEPNLAFDVIRSKIRSSSSGSIIGYGVKIFPEGRDLR